jgi:hypothetical protein
MRTSRNAHWYMKNCFHYLFFNDENAEQKENKVDDFRAWGWLVTELKRWAPSRPSSPMGAAEMSRPFVPKGLNADHRILKAINGETSESGSLRATEEFILWHFDQWRKCGERDIGRKIWLSECRRRETDREEQYLQYLERQNSEAGRKKRLERDVQAEADKRERAQLVATKGAEQRHRVEERVQRQRQQKEELRIHEKQRKEASRAQSRERKDREKEWQREKKHKLKSNLKGTDELTNTTSGSISIGNKRKPREIDKLMDPHKWEAIEG